MKKLEMKAYDLSIIEALNAVFPWHFLSITFYLFLLNCRKMKKSVGNRIFPGKSNVLRSRQNAGKKEWVRSEKSKRLSRRLYSNLQRIYVENKQENGWREKMSQRISRSATASITITNLIKYFYHVASSYHWIIAVANSVCDLAGFQTLPIK